MNPPVSVPVPPGVVTETSWAPGAASAAMHIFAVICVRLFTVTLFTVMPVPKLTAVGPAKLVPVMTTVRHCPCRPLAGLTAVTVGGSGVLSSTEILLADIVGHGQVRCAVPVEIAHGDRDGLSSAAWFVAAAKAPRPLPSSTETLLLPRLATARSGAAVQVEITLGDGEGSSSRRIVHRRGESAHAVADQYANIVAV